MSCVEDILANEEIAESERDEESPSAGPLAECLDEFRSRLQGMQDLVSYLLEKNQRLRMQLAAVQPDGESNGE